MKIILLYCLLMLLSFTVCAQSLSKSLGNMKTMKKSAQGITIQTDFGNLKATVYSPNVVKINITRNNVFTDFSYAVNVSPTEAVKFTVTEDKSKITLATDSLTLTISKQPVRVALYNKAGQLINSDDADFGTSWIDDEITT